MTKEHAIRVLSQILDGFPTDEMMKDLEPDTVGAGYRFYSTERFTDLFIREARMALEVLK